MWNSFTMKQTTRAAVQAPTGIEAGRQVAVTVLHKMDASRGIFADFLDGRVKSLSRGEELFKEALFLVSNSLGFQGVVKVRGKSPMPVVPEKMARRVFAATQNARRVRELALRASGSKRRRK